ncbi:MAG: response regulator transcription factor, partial [Sphingobium sp.]
MRIAIADDEETIRDFLSTLLSEAGHRCLVYRDGRELVNGLQRDTFDLIIVDWMMPGMSGLELLRWIRSSINSCPPVIMLTSRSEKKDIAEALNAGADDYIVKPEARNVILARVDAVMRRTGTQAALP